MLTPDQGRIDALGSMSQKKVACLWAGSNDIFSAIETTIYNNWVAWNTQRRKSAYVKAATIIPRVDMTGDYETRRQALNTLMRADYSSCDELIDLAAIPQLQDPANHTYYQNDGIHLKDAGYAIVANAFYNSGSGF